MEIPVEWYRFCGNIFFGQTSEMGQILTNGFATQNEPQTAKLSFQVF